MLWVALILLGAVILVAGRGLSRHADVIAEKTGLGRVWIGLLLIGVATSLPELVTGVSSVALYDMPDIAISDALGSCVFNMMLLSILDVVAGPTSLWSKARQGHIISGSFAIVLLALVGMGSFWDRAFGGLGWIGWYTPVIVALYAAALRLTLRYEREQSAALAERLQEESRLYGEKSLGRAGILYGANAAVIVAAALFLPAVAGRLAAAHGMSQTFVGTLFVAGATSLPELAVSISAVRLGAVDLAVGNLFGSNLFNVFILGIDDAFYRRGPLLGSVSPEGVIPVLAAIIMTALAVAGLMYRPKRTFLSMAWDTMAIGAFYLLTMVLLYVLS